ncbi:hypothetical protein HJC23_005431 [Cyclotella cryptica]|eukprot:CCRYP_010013-RA/>CCRYP_010013-RA protein AED:0.01 eAED:0.01 QI:0/-1/0/1/-1/1/1/0/362
MTAIECVSTSERTDTQSRRENDTDERNAYEVHVDGTEHDSTSMFMCCNGWDAQMGDIQAAICGLNKTSVESRDDVTVDQETGREQSDGAGNEFIDSALEGITSTVSKEFERSRSAVVRKDDIATVPSSDSVKSRQSIKKTTTTESAKSTEANSTEVMTKLNKDLFVGSVKRSRYESFKSMIDAASSTYGAYSLQVAELYASMATDLLENNSDDKTSRECAVILFEEAFHIFQTKSGDSDGRTLDMKVRLGRSLVACGRYDDALKYFCQAVYMKEALLGELHPSVSDIWVLIASVHQKKKKMEMALRANAKALTGYRNAHGDKHITVINVLKTIAKLHIEMGNSDKAEDINRYVRLHSPKGKK